MAKVQKALILLFYAVLAITLIPAVLPLIVGEAAWILIPVLVIFLLAFPVLVVLKKDD
jgi:hypothetical protein